MKGLVLAIACVAAAACSNDRSSSQPDANTPPTCGTGTFCLKPHPVAMGNIPNGRLIVAFYQFVDNFTPYPGASIGLDIALDPKAPTIEIALSSIALPSPRNRYDLCLRSCFDENDPSCVCQQGSPAVATAVVLVVSDLNDSGKTEPEELNVPNIYGAGFMHIDASDLAFPANNPLSNVFPEGILEGISPYRIIESPTSFDQLGLPPTPATFDLDLCIPNDEASCDSLRMPNLS